MPLLNKQTFIPEPIPSDIRPNEEVFVCQATKEVFRDYEKFFNRHFLCNSLVWTCELTGATNLTYTQALECEEEANRLLNSLPECYQKASLVLVHHARRTNVRTLADEICAFHRERYIVGEQLDLSQTTTSGAKIVSHVRALKVVLPPKPVLSPVRVPVISTIIRSPTIKFPPPLIPISPPSTTASSMEGGAQLNGPQDASPQVLNGLPSNDISLQDINVSSARVKSPKTPRTSQPPLSAEVNLNPADYKYIIELVENPETKLQVPAKQLSRPKGVFTPKKLKLFLRNALHRPSEKYPFFVKEEYVQKFDLGTSTVSLEPLPTPTPRSRKRTLSQASLEMFFTPGSAEAKRQRPTSLDTSSSRKKGKKKKTPSKGSKSKKGSKTKSPYSTAGSSKKSPTKTLKPPKSPSKTPRSKMEALKALNKAKKFKQMDLKKTVVRNETRLPLSEEEMIEFKRRAEEEHQLKTALIEAEKLRKKEQRLRKLREHWEQRRLEKLRQQELMKPREDLLCEDSKALPGPTAVRTELPMELFGDAVMVLEFLHTFGPLFNLKEAIPAGINFEKIEYAVVTNDTESLLYEIVKFLLQALFAIMEEEKENRVEVYMGDKIEGMESDSQDDDREKGSKELPEGLESEEVIVPVDNHDMETDERPLDQVDVDEKPLDIRVESLKVSATMLAKWPYLTQKALLNELVLDPFTITEVLRVHLLSSGGYAEHVNRKLFRTYHRGNYTDADEPALALRLRRPDIFDTLSQTALYDLPPSDKLEILSTLCSQLLTYSVSREHIDEAARRAKKARKTIREKKAMHKKQEKDIQLQNTLSKQKQKEEAIATTSGESAPAAENSVDNQDGSTVPVESLASKDRTPPPRRSSKDNEKPVVSETDHCKQTEAAEEITEEERKERIDKELGELGKEITEASSVVNLRPIGSDRHHRRYWLFPSLPGLYVEDSGYFPTEVLSRDKEAVPMDVDVKKELDHTQSPQLRKSTSMPVAAQVQLPRTSSEPTPVRPHSALQFIDLTLGSPEKHQRDAPILINILQAANLVQQQEGNANLTHEQENKPLPRERQPSQQLPQEVPVQTSRLSWSCYTMPEDIDNLISSLNPRGVREVELKKALETHTSLLLRKLPKCPFLPTSERSPYAPQKYSSARQYLELYLREQILDFEEKLYVGNLGYIKNVESREKWRNAIENSGAAADVGITMDENDGSTLEVPPNGDSRSVSPAPLEAEHGFRLKSGNITPMVNPSVRELSKALLQVQGGIEKKYLMPPLGTAIDEKNKKPKGGKKNGIVKESDLCVDQWRASLAKSTNFSQIFLHMATLERAVMWSKSLMNLRCRICRKKTGDEYLLLCDGCDYGYHTFCLRPPLTSIPDGDWFCYNCNPITPVKPKRQAKRVMVVVQEEESSESESEEEQEESGGSDEDDGNGKSDDDDTESEEEEEVVITKRSLRSRRQSAEVASNVRRSTRTVGQNLKKSKEKSLAKKGTKTFTSEKSKNKTPEVSSSYESTKARKKLKLDDVPSPLHHSKAESVIASIIDLKCSRTAKHLTSAGKREQKGLEMQLCEALWNEVNDHDDSWHFATPIKKKDYPTYLEVIDEPMDLRTIRGKIKCGKYSGIDDFLSDMDLVFSNCLTFHKRLSEVGRAGTAVKKFFEKRCNDLGLRDLLCERSEDRAGSGLGLRSSRRSKS